MTLGLIGANVGLLNPNVFDARIGEGVTLTATVVARVDLGLDTCAGLDKGRGTLDTSVCALKA